MSIINSIKPLQLNWRSPAVEIHCILWYFSLKLNEFFVKWMEQFWCKNKDTIMAGLLKLMWNIYCIVSSFFQLNFSLIFWSPLVLQCNMEIIDCAPTETISDEKKQFYSFLFVILMFLFLFLWHSGGFLALATGMSHSVLRHLLLLPHPRPQSWAGCSYDHSY